MLHKFPSLQGLGKNNQGRGQLLPQTPQKDHFDIGLSSSCPFSALMDAVQDNVDSDDLFGLISGPHSGEAHSKQLIHR